jgi:hypothetical protein
MSIESGPARCRRAATVDQTASTRPNGHAPEKYLKPTRVRLKETFRISSATVEESGSYS